MDIKKRLLSFITHKDISKLEFYKNISVKNGFLDKGDNIRSDILGNILLVYPEVNIEWLVLGKGEMLKTGRQEAVISEPVCFQSCCYISDLRYTIEVQKKLIGILSNANKSV